MIGMSKPKFLRRRKRDYQVRLVVERFQPECLRKQPRYSQQANLIVIFSRFGQRSKLARDAQGSTYGGTARQAD